MELSFVVVIGIVLLYAFYEYRLRKPDQIVLLETKDGFAVRKSRFYPRHFSFVMTRSAHSFTQTVDASAKGNLDVRVKLAVTCAASMNDLGTLLRVAGWSPDAVQKAAKEMEIVLMGYVKECTEQYEIGELSSEKIRTYLMQRTDECKKKLGLEILALTVASFEALNAQIAEAMRQREHARILEQTEVLSQQARTASVRVRLKADEEIAAMEHELELKKLDLKSAELAKDSALATQRAEHELRLKKMQLESEKDELRLLKENPELLLLTPQAARLAEASQSLKNARTIVSLSPNEVGQGTEILGIFQTLLHKALESFDKKKKEKS